MNSPPEITKRKNSNLSILLIVLNMVIVYAYTHISYNSEDAEARNLLLYAISLAVLLGSYAFSYHGKAYRWGKWLFGLMIIITLVMMGLLWYATQLGHAFQH